MDFLIKRFFYNDTLVNKDTVLEQNETVSNGNIEETSQSIPENVIFAPHPVNLMRRLFHNQKTALSEAPETPYENEAWAPETDFVGLFHKHRVTKEQSKSFSDTQ